MGTDQASRRLGHLQVGSNVIAVAVGVKHKGNILHAQTQFTQDLDELAVGGAGARVNQSYSLAADDVRPCEHLLVEEGLDGVDSRCGLHRMPLPPSSTVAASKPTARG